MKCVTGKGDKDEQGKIIVYTAKWCGACKKRVPQIIKKANAAGLEVKLIDWDEDLSEKDRVRLIKRVEYVPYIDYLGNEIEEEDLDHLIKTRKGAPEPLRTKLIGEWTKFE